MGPMNPALSAIVLLLLFAVPAPGASVSADSARTAAAPSTAEVKSAMLDATRFMVEQVSVNGGYLRLYRSDFKRRWAELEAYDTQIMLTYGRTPAMGHLFLNAYDVTGEQFYYHAAEKVARALVWGQHKSGGWDYLIDFAGEGSLKRWYETIGRNAWGWNEYNHYYGVPTFKNGTTVEAARFLLRFYLKRLDPAFRPPLERAISFILDSQFPEGSWPQRWPEGPRFSHQDNPEYVYHHIFNDDLTWENIEFLIQCYLHLGDTRLPGPIRRGMEAFLLTQQGNPQGGWAQQYDKELRPAAGRPYEPAALLPRKTLRHAGLLMRFYRYTGDRKFLARIPDAIEWLERARLPEEMSENGRFTHPVFVEIGTDRPLFAHREGSGVNDGRYWVDGDDSRPLLHYGAKSRLEIEPLRREYERLLDLPPEEVTTGSPLLPHTGRDQISREYLIPAMTFPRNRPEPAEARAIIDALDEEGRWLSTGEWISRPYRVDESGRESNTALMSTEGGAQIRDDSGQSYISTDLYMRYMNLLLNYIEMHAKTEK